MLAQKTVKSRQTANISPTSSHRYLLKLENNGIIERLGIADNPTIYVFTDRKDSLDNKPEYSDEVLSLISDLQESDSSIKDRRIGDMLYNCLDRGFISILDYQNIEEQQKWKTDMVFAEQLGLVKCVDKTTYSICTQIDRSNASLPEAQKDILTAMYDFFGEDAFSADKRSHMTCSFNIIKQPSCGGHPHSRAVAVTAVWLRIGCDEPLTEHTTVPCIGVFPAPFLH